MTRTSHTLRSAAGPSLWRELRWILGKDLRTGRQILALPALSALLAAGVVAACALAGGTQGRQELACAAIWVSVAFCGAYGASNAYASEQSSGVLQVLVCGPIRGVALYLGKGASVLLLTGAGALVATMLTALLIHDHALWTWPGRLLGLVAAGCFGFSVVGALVAPLLGLGSGREALLALVLLPLGVPLVVSGARGTAALFSTPAALDVYLDSLGLVVGLDALFLALALWLFEPLVRRR